MAASLCCAEEIESLSTEFDEELFPWENWMGASTEIDEQRGWVEIDAPDDAFSGIRLPGGPIVKDFPPPWHVEVRIDRPDGEPSAIGMILQQDGIQHLHSFIPDATAAGEDDYFGYTAYWDGNGKGAFGPGGVWQGDGISEADQASDPFQLYFGVVNDTTIRWGVWSIEEGAWAFLPDKSGFSLSEDPVSWQNMMIMIENRDGWFEAMGGTGPDGATVVDIDYIRFFSGLVTTAVDPAGKLAARWAEIKVSR